MIVETSFEKILFFCLSFLGSRLDLSLFCNFFSFIQGNHECEKDTYSFIDEPLGNIFNLTLMLLNFLPVVFPFFCVRVSNPSQIKKINKVSSREGDQRENLFKIYKSKSSVFHLVHILDSVYVPKTRKCLLNFIVCSFYYRSWSCLTTDCGINSYRFVTTGDYSFEAR